MHKETDKRGNLVCRFCRHSRFTPQKKGRRGEFICRIGDNPGPVFADEAECEYGEMCRESEHCDRDQAEAT